MKQELKPEKCWPGRDETSPERCAGWVLGISLGAPPPAGCQVHQSMCKEGNSAPLPSHFNMICEVLGRVGQSADLKWKERCKVSK